MPTQDIDDYTTLVSVSLTTPGAVKILDPSGNEIDPRQIRALTTSDAITPYGSQTQKLLQRPSTYELLVALALAGVEIDPRLIRTLTSVDCITAYGSQGVPLQQRASTLELLVQLVLAGAEIDPRAIRALTSTDAISVYGSQTQKILQRGSTYDSLVQLRHDGNEINPQLSDHTKIKGVDLVTPQVSGAIPVSLERMPGLVSGLASMRKGPLSGDTLVKLQVAAKPVGQDSYVGVYVDVVGEGWLHFVYSCVDTHNATPFFVGIDDQVIDGVQMCSWVNPEWLYYGVPAGLGFQFGFGAGERMNLHPISVLRYDEVAKVYAMAYVPRVPVYFAKRLVVGIANDDTAAAHNCVSYLVGFEVKSSTSITYDYTKQLVTGTKWSEW